MPGPSRRAVEVLERLAGDRPDEPETPRARRDPIPRPPTRTLLVAGAVALAVVGIAVLLVVDRRMPPVEERLPLASAQPTSTVASTATSTVTSVSAADGGQVVVHVAGAVAAPGVVELPAGGRVVDAVRAAGGLRPDADPDRVNLAAQLADGQRIVIPVVGQEPPSEVQPSRPAGGSGTSDEPGTLIDLNTATAEQLESLPGVGPATAAAIIAHRERSGPFTSVDGLIDVRGIGEGKLEALRDLVVVGGAP